MSEHTRPFSRRAFVGGAAAFGISLCLPPLMPAKAHAVTAAEKQAEANAALEKLNAMQEKLDRAEVSLYAAETERDAGGICIAALWPAAVLGARVPVRGDAAAVSAPAETL